MSQRGQKPGAHECKKVVSNVGSRSGDAGEDGLVGKQERRLNALQVVAVRNESSTVDVVDHVLVDSQSVGVRLCHTGPSGVGSINGNEGVGIIERDQRNGSKLASCGRNLSRSKSSSDSSRIVEVGDSERSTSKGGVDNRSDESLIGSIVNFSESLSQEFRAVGRGTLSSGASVGVDEISGDDVVVGAGVDDLEAPGTRTRVSGLGLAEGRNLGLSGLDGGIDGGEELLRIAPGDLAEDVVEDTLVSLNAVGSIEESGLRNDLALSVLENENSSVETKPEADNCSSWELREDWSDSRSHSLVNDEGVVGRNGSSSGVENSRLNESLLGRDRHRTRSLKNVRGGESSCCKRVGRNDEVAVEDIGVESEVGGEHYTRSSPSGGGGSGSSSPSVRGRGRGGRLGLVVSSSTMVISPLAVVGASFVVTAVFSSALPMESSFAISVLPIGVSSTEIHRPPPGSGLNKSESGEESDIELIDEHRR